MYSRSILDDTNPDIPRVLGDGHTHPMEKRDVQEHSEHGFFAHDQSGTLAVCLADVELECPCSPLFPLILLAQSEELGANHVHDVLVFFASVHFTTRGRVSYNSLVGTKWKTYLLGRSTQA